EGGQKYRSSHCRGLSRVSGQPSWNDASVAPNSPLGHHWIGEPVDMTLEEHLKEAGADDQTIEAVIASGYNLWGFVEPFSMKTWPGVMDFLYGNKQSSSCFDLSRFVRYATLKDNPFASVPAFHAIVINDRSDIARFLAEPRIQAYLSEGSLSFR